MKKKLLLIALMVALFVCLFVISTSATDIPEWTDVITYETGENAIAYKDGFDTTSRVLLDNGDGTYSTYPTNYIIKGTDTKFSVKNELDFTALKTASGNSTYSYASVIRFEMPVGYTTVEARAFKSDQGFTNLQTVKVCEGVTEMGINIFYDTTTVVEVELPSTLTTIGEEFARNAKGLEKINIPKNLTAIPKNAFIYCSSLKTVDFSKSEKLTSIGYYAFYQTTSLESALIPEGVTHLDDLAFKLSGVKKVYLPSTLETIDAQAFASCSSLTQLDCKSTIIGASMFADCTSLVSVDLSSVTTIGEKGFYTTANSSTSALTTVIFSEKLRSIGNYAFIRSAITSVEIPSSLTTIGVGTFMESKSLQKVVFLGSIMGETMFQKCSSLSELVITEKFITYGSSALNDISTTFTAYYTGTDYSRVKSLCNMSRFNHSNYSSYEDYLAGNHKQGNYMFIYGCNLCDVAYDSVHLPASAMHEHTSYTASSYLVTGCPRCLEESSRVEVAPIFDGFGYSARIENNGDTKRALVFSYFINTDSLEIYKTYNPEKTLSFGIVGAFESKITNADSEVYNPLNADGTAVQGNVVAYSITNEEIISIDFIIKGEQATWEANGIPSSPIYMLGYVIDDTGLYYIGNNTEKVASQSANITDLRTITYNELFTE